MRRSDLAPMRKITVSNAPDVNVGDAIVIITEAIPEAGRACAERVGGRIIARVPSILPSVVIKRRLADAGIDADVDTIVRFV